MAACPTAIMSPLRSRNGPQARMAVEFLVELPKLALRPVLEDGRLWDTAQKDKIGKIQHFYQSTVQK